MKKCFSMSLLRLMQKPKETVYFLKGHEEKSIENTKGNGLSLLMQALRRENLIVQGVASSF